MNFNFEQKGVNFSEQSLNLKITCFKEKVLIVEDDLTSCEYETAEDRTILIMKEKNKFNLSMLEAVSFNDRIDFMREETNVPPDLRYETVCEIEDRLDREAQFKERVGVTDLDSLSYEKILQRLTDRTLRRFQAVSSQGEKLKIDEFSKIPMMKSHRVLGSGVYGVAYLFTKRDKSEKFNHETEESKKMDRFYVVKVIKKTDNSEPRFLEYMRYEAYLNMLTFHPNVVECLGFYHRKCELLYVMEFLPFQNIIKNIVQHPGGLKVQDLRYLTAQIAMAIEYLHSIQYSFNDLHVGNVCMDYKGFIKLIDFGMGKPFAHVHDKDSAPDAVQIPARIFADPSLAYNIDVNRFSSILSSYLVRAIASTEDPAEVDVVHSLIRETQFAPATDPPDRCLPKITQVRAHQFYTTVDFKKLLLRQIDLSTVYSTSFKDLYMMNPHQSWGAKGMQSTSTHFGLNALSVKRRLDNKKTEAIYEAGNKYIQDNFF